MYLLNIVVQNHNLINLIIGFNVVVSFYLTWILYLKRKIILNIKIIFFNQF